LGIELQSARFLLACRFKNISFRRTATIGHQHFFVKKAQVRPLLAEFDFHPEPAQLAEIESCCGTFADPFLRFLGAEELVSLDASSFENATVVHDMNFPIPATLKERFDLVYDGGSLEHIFNFPSAIANCMEMLRPGGHFVGVNPANNLSGHGFYQFSPELYYRVFSPEHGMRMLHVVVAESVGPFYSVPDPITVNRRVMWVNSEPANMMVLAQKQASVPLFGKPPQQSDYSSLWQGKILAPEPVPTEPALKTRVKKAIFAVERALPPVRSVTGSIRRFRHRRDQVRVLLAGLNAQADLVPLPGYRLPTSEV
jgi:SAM-dependent methyltransferase